MILRVIFSEKTAYSVFSLAGAKENLKNTKGGPHILAD